MARKPKNVPHPHGESEDAVLDMMGSILSEESAEQFWERLYTRGHDLALVTDLNRKEIDYIVAAMWYANKFDIPIIHELIEWHMALRVSLKRRGRSEAVKAMTGLAEEKARSILRLKRFEG